MQRFRTIVSRYLPIAAASGFSLLAAACADAGSAPRSVVAETRAAEDSGPTRFQADERAAIATLAAHAGYSSQNGAGFILEGRVLADADVSGDSLVEPTHDRQACNPFRDIFMPRRNEGVGNAVVWIADISSGKADDLPRRTTVRLNDCSLHPRVHVIARGGTVLVGSGDAMVSRLRFADATGTLSDPRALISFNDFGQVVPSRDVARTSGLVEIRDDKHPWVRGFVVVASHPYVVVTAPDGSFRIDDVPAGIYEVIVFSEALGVLRQRVDVGADTRLELRFGRRVQEITEQHY